MKYLKYFQENSEYAGFKNSSDYVLPNVSYVVEDSFVDYNAYVIEKIIMQVGNKYPDVVERFKSMVNNIFPSAISNTINDMMNSTEAPEYVKDWKVSYAISGGNVDINAVYDENIASYNLDHYVLTFYMDALWYDPSIDIDNINWEDPSIEEKILDVSGIKVSQLLSSEDIDFIKSISIDYWAESTPITSIYMQHKEYDESGNFVGNQGVFNELEYINLCCSRWFGLSSADNYELKMAVSPA